MSEVTPAQLLKAKRPGDPIRAAEWNALTARTFPQIVGEGVIQEGNKFHILPTEPDLDNRPFLVLVKRVGGFPGDAQTKCSYLYDVWAFRGDIDNDDERIGESMPVLYGRTDLGAFNYARDGTIAEAALDNDGNMILMRCLDERPQTQPCSGT